MQQQNTSMDPQVVADMQEMLTEGCRQHNNNLSVASHEISWPESGVLSLQEMNSTEAWMLHMHMQSHNPAIKIYDFKLGNQFFGAEVEMTDNVYFMVLRSQGDWTAPIEIYGIRKSINENDGPEPWCISNK